MTKISAQTNSNVISNKVWNILRCPFCLGTIQNNGLLYECQQCGENYEISNEGQPDLRLKKTKTYNLNIEISSSFDSTYDLHISDNYWLIPFAPHIHPEVDFKGVRIPARLNIAQLSHFPKAKTKDDLMLNLGCGEGIHREVCQHAGFEYVGVDIRDQEAHILGDAHALPFADNSFDFILAIATLEHLRNPFIAIREAHRVLKPGATLLGSVAFLEPFHDSSYFHHSYYGLNYLLQDAGFKIKALGPEGDWPVLRALAEMILFPKLPKSLSNFLVAPIHILHKLWWKAGSKIVKTETSQEKYRLLATTGSLTFAVEKKIPTA
ncbi:MAG: methyltransferase domain-containing protein [Desulfobaccales bacterium]